MSTPFLFHGPLARGEAVAHARLLGRMISDPVGDDGLKVDDSRLLVDLAGSAGVGDLPPVVVVGPLDLASPEASDALLKTLEDLAEGPLRLVLWADYLGGVSKTIRSRTLDRWCPPDGSWVSPYLDEHADALYKAWSAGDAAGCMAVCTSRAKDWQALIQGFCEILSKRDVLNPKAVRAWVLLRPLLDGKGSHLTAAMAMLKSLDEGAA